MNNYKCDHCGKYFQLEKPAIECPFCFWTSSIVSLSEDVSGKVSSAKTHQSNIDWSAMGRQLGGLSFILGIIFLITFVPGFFRNVINGKMTTKQYYEEVYVPDMKQIPPKIEKMISGLREVANRVSNKTASNAHQVSEKEVVSNKPSVEKTKTPLEQMMEEARRNLILPEYTEIPSMRGVSPEEKDFQNTSYYFTADIIDALKFVYDGEQLFKEMNKKSEDEIKEQLYGTYFEKLRFLRAATNIIKPYAKSSDERISTAAKIALMVLVQQFNYTFDMLAFTKYIETYVPETDKDMRNTYQIISEMKYEMQRIRKEYDGTYRDLLNAVILITHSLVDQTPDKNGHLSSLNITALEKARLIQQMQKSFGNIPAFESGLSYADCPMAALYQFLTTSEHTPKSDTK